MGYTVYVLRCWEWFKWGPTGVQDLIGTDFRKTVFIKSQINYILPDDMRKIIILTISQKKKKIIILTI